MSAWKLETAKAQLSELVRRAREQGPQRITVRGRAAAVVLSDSDYERLAGLAQSESWVERLRRTPLPDDFEFGRDNDSGRDLDL